MTAKKKDDAEDVDDSCPQVMSDDTDILLDDELERESKEGKASKLVDPKLRMQIRQYLLAMGLAGVKRSHVRVK